MTDNQKEVYRPGAIKLEGIRLSAPQKTIKAKAAIPIKKPLF